MRQQKKRPSNPYSKAELELFIEKYTKQEDYIPRYEIKTEKQQSGNDKLMKSTMMETLRKNKIKTKILTSGKVNQFGFISSISDHFQDGFRHARFEKDPVWEIIDSSPMVEAEVEPVLELKKQKQLSIEEEKDEDNESEASESSKKNAQTVAAPIKATHTLLPEDQKTMKKAMAGLKNARKFKIATQAKKLSHIQASKDKLDASSVSSAHVSRDSLFSSTQRISRTSVTSESRPSQSQDDFPKITISVDSMSSDAGPLKPPPPRSRSNSRTRPTWDSIKQSRRPSFILPDISQREESNSKSLDNVENPFLRVGSASKQRGSFFKEPSGGFMRERSVTAIEGEIRNSLGHPHPERLVRRLSQYEGVKLPSLQAESELLITRRQNHVFETIQTEASVVINIETSASDAGSNESLEQTPKFQNPFSNDCQLYDTKDHLPSLKEWMDFINLQLVDDDPRPVWKAVNIDAVAEFGTTVYPPELLKRPSYRNDTIYQKKTIEPSEDEAKDSKKEKYLMVQCPNLPLKAKTRFWSPPTLDHEISC